MLKETYTITLIRAAVQAFSSTDAELGATINRMSQQSIHHISKLDDKALSDDAKTCLNPFFATLLPEISARLMERDGVTVGLRRDAIMRTYSNEALRREFVDVFTSSSFTKFRDALTLARRDGDCVLDIDLAMSQATNGNLALLALDRIAAPDMASDDLGDIIRLAAPVRGTTADNGMWHPGMADMQLLEFGAFTTSPHMEDNHIEDDYLEEIDNPQYEGVAV